MKKIYFVTIAICALLISCKEESVEPEMVVCPLESIFPACECDVDTLGAQSEYIKAEIDGVPMCFDVVPNFQNDFGNMFLYGNIIKNNESVYYDNTHLIRNTKNSLWQIAFYLENTHALTKTYPYQLPRQNPEVCEIGELQLNGGGISFSNPFALNKMQLQVNGFKDGYFEGVFSGIARAADGLNSVQIREGKFRIKLTQINRDLNVNAPPIDR